MLINHDTRCALDHVVELLNTAPATGEGERLTDVAALRTFVGTLTVSGIAPADLTEADLQAVLRTRERFERVLASDSGREVAGLLNEMVASAGTTPQLTDHDGYDWHVHYFAPGASLADHLAADCGMALGFLLVAGELERLRHCEAPDCGRAFVDLSRNRSRRYCDSRTCGNRLHVAAYRARQRRADAAR
ncbi:CGNR zinc finger domain-containing protein [Streptomyces spiramenti]|uniref:CGNR zinc finger domain-containing protein n=1 Tax=Streptomyces spiramenti TaxID=2720606 RepID=A0ABX1AL03_9ACTN|nr:CGNR zinc finger domain-containing protein [Streptomyces spiramenti]